MFKFATHVVARLRTPVLVRARRIVAAHRLEETPTEQHRIEVHQLLLFASEGGKQKRQRKAAPKQRRIKGKQYSLKLKCRATPRKIAYRPHATKEESSNALDWSEQGMYRLHSILLKESMESLKAMCEKKSTRAAEIIAWMFRNEPGATFSFEECCRLFNMEMKDPDSGEFIDVGQQDPDILRSMAKRWIANAYGAELPHAQVLREAILAAESGDHDAIEWILSDQQTPLSFVECADALGFDPEDARTEVRLPQPQLNVDPLDSGIQRIIDRVFGHPSRAALAA
ncbi:hypothetical protein RKE25_22670 (plasmid) [Dyella sp. BiH032]|uniref:hypothetical protein n=1 Tax=Dyella sp. BiH032 TaxID=3075430 RepID=UPI0028934A87|nr:hypothetical protein [Dyella sp. BiH032]WNL48339.1 hypothetical protein RKE25_22670 [Dyella sp. BiH032]